MRVSIALLKIRNLVVPHAGPGSAATASSLTISGGVTCCARARGAAPSATTPRIATNAQEVSLRVCMGNHSLRRCDAFERSRDCGKRNYGVQREALGAIRRRVYVTFPSNPIRCTE
jgi:hypothetical protein